MQTDIVIIGAGLTGLTAAFQLKNKGKKVVVLEKNNRIGGQIQTFNEAGFTFECGPNTGVVSYPEVAELFQALEGRCQMETAHEEAKRRLIWKNGRFVALPSGPLSAITTPLFTLKDKFRILGEPFRAKGTDPDEPVGSLARRRLGNSFLDYAVDPFLSGVYAGDPMQLITRYALPKLYRLEQDYGSFIRGTIAKAKLPKTERDRLATKKVFSATGGLSQLTKALSEAIGKEAIRLSAHDTRLVPPRQENGCWTVETTTPEGPLNIETRQVITTVGAYALPELLPFVSTDEMIKISRLTYAPVIQASVGVSDTEGLRFNAFGGLIPSCEKQELLGILYPSACFDYRAPEKGALFSFFIGGVKQAEKLEWSDNQLTDLVERNFHALLKFPAGKQPDLIRLFRHPRAIPQYGIDSGERFQAIERIEARYPGLTLAGNIKGGIGMADRIRQAMQITG